MLPHTRQPGGLARRHFVSVRGLPISASMRGLLLRLSSMEVSDAGRPPSRTRSLTTFNLWNLIYSDRISGDLFPFNIDIYENKFTKRSTFLTEYPLNNRPYDRNELI